jgi:uncharacterized protein
MTLFAEKAYSVPARAGVGLKPEHGEEILASQPDIGWFEVHPENYMGEGGAPHHMLTRICEKYPLSLHGVGLSIGAARPLDTDHLMRLKALNERYQPGLFSEHLAWSTHEVHFLNDLLPLPYTDESLEHIGAHIAQVQDTLQRQILIENPSTYVVYSDNAMSETQFLRALAKQTGCGLLLDVNNVYVSAVNHAFDAQAYLDDFPLEHVGEIHLAGHAPFEDADGKPFLIDAHDRAVIEDVWNLYESILARIPSLPTLIEWDNDVPSWPVLLAEARKADALLMRKLNTGLPNRKQRHAHV